MDTATFVGRERPRPDWLRRHPRAWVAVVGTVGLGAFMGQLDASVVALTYRAIGHDFHAPLSSVQWVSLSYLAVLAVLLVPVGRLSDRRGRKRIYLWGFGVFAVASAGCALAPSLGVLVALRSVQAIGAAMLQANSVALVATAAPQSRLQLALGAQAAAQALGLTLGPTLGGLIVQTVGWRWVFAINIPVGVVAVVAGRYLLPRTRVRHGAGPARVRTVLRTRRIRAGLLGAGLGYLALFGPIVLVPAVLQSGGTSALNAGLVVAALPFGFAVAASLLVRMLPAALLPAQRARLGALTAGVALGVLVLVVHHPDGCAAALAVTGLGIGLFTPANNAMVMAARPAGTAAITGGLISTARALGTAAATAVAAGLLTLDASGHAAAGALALLCLMAVFTV